MAGKKVSPADHLKPLRDEDEIPNQKAKALSNGFSSKVKDLYQGNLEITDFDFNIWIDQNGLDSETKRVLLAAGFSSFHSLTRIKDEDIMELDLQRGRMRAIQGAVARLCEYVGRKPQF